MFGRGDAGGGMNVYEQARRDAFALVRWCIADPDGSELFIRINPDMGLRAMGIEARRRGHGLDYPA